MPKRLLSLVLLLVAIAWGNFAPVHPDHVRVSVEMTDPTPIARLPDPEYPEELIGIGWEGECTVGFYIDEEGDVRKAWIIRSTGESAADEAALITARASKWNPATIDGEPEARQISITFRFQIQTEKPSTTEPKTYA